MNKWPHAGPWTTLIYKTLSALEFGCCQSACCAAVVCRRFLFVVLPFLIYIAPRTAVAIQWRSQCENSIGLLSHLSLRLLFLPIAISLPLPPNPFPSFGSSILYALLLISFSVFVVVVVVVWDQKLFLDIYWRLLSATDDEKPQRRIDHTHYAPHRLLTIPINSKCK